MRQRIWNSNLTGFFITGPGNFTGIDWRRYRAEMVSAPNMNGAVDCEFDLIGRHVTVRDSPGSDNGAALCVIMGDPRY